MIFYRVEYYGQAGESEGFEWFAKRREALRAVKETGSASATIERISIRLTAEGVLEALNRYASHNDNG